MPMEDIHSVVQPEWLDAILAETKLLRFNMASEPRTGSLLRTLAQSKPNGRMLELGTGTGIATAWILDGMCNDSTLVTVENDHSVSLVARRHLGHDQRLTIVEDDAAAYLGQLDGEQFDLVFADTWAGKYTHLDQAIRTLKNGGLYVIDDMLPQANWPEGHAARASELIAILAARRDLSLTKLSWASGIIIGAKFSR